MNEKLSVSNLDLSPDLDVDGILSITQSNDDLVLLHNSIYLLFHLFFHLRFFNYFVTLGSGSGSGSSAGSNNNRSLMCLLAGTVLKLIAPLIPMRFETALTEADFPRGSADLALKVLPPLQLSIELCNFCNFVYGANSMSISTELTILIDFFLD